MAIWINFLTALASLSVLNGVTHSAPTGADQVAQQPTNFRIPFSLDLEPPALPNNADVTIKLARFPLKDSYGNPIQPAILGAVPIITSFDLRNPSNTGDNTKKTILMQGINFPIPSYASGITEIRKPSNGLLPPIDSSEVLKTSTNTPISHTNADILQPPSNVHDALNEISGKALQERFGTDFNVQQLPVFVNSLQHLNNPSETAASAAPIPQQTSNGAPEVPQIPTPSSGIGKYTGGFGGAQGILGEQNQIGYAIKPEGASPSSPYAPAPAPAEPGPISGKYTGGFGGPPGILAPYDNVNKSA